MRVFVTGGTGLIGRSLVHRLLERGDQPVVLSRHADSVRRNPAMRPVQVIQGDPGVAGGWDSAIDGSDAVVNLAGHNVFENRWSTEIRRKIRDSRVYSAENVVAAIARARSRPKVLVQGSAIGFYGPHGDEEVTESSPSGSDFLAVVCREWEEAASPAESLDVRLATLRTGVVLARGEGALGVMAPKFKAFYGAAPVGSGGSWMEKVTLIPWLKKLARSFQPAGGHQWMSWIHIDDIVGLILLALDNHEAHGPINGTAPHPVRNHEFGRALAAVLKRPFIPIGPPDALLELIMGDVAQVVTTGAKVLPTEAERLGYRFKYTDVLTALQAIFAKAPAPPAPAPVPARAASSGHHH